MPDFSPRCQEFLDHLEAIVQRGASKEDTVLAVKDMVTDALEEHGWLPERCLLPAPGCYARHLLYKDPAERFAVVVMVWQRGQKTPIHDHGGMWCVEGVYQGRIRVHRYDVDGVVEGVATLHACEVIDSGIGATGALIPPVDYHLIENERERTAITVHTYGGDMKQCHVYLPRPDGLYDVRSKDLAYTSLPSHSTVHVSSHS